MIVSLIIVLLILSLSMIVLVMTRGSNSKNRPTFAATPQPNGGPAGPWSLIFDDEFNGTSLNTSVWTPGWFGTGITGPVNTAETTCYDSAQVSEPGDGYLHLHLIAQQVSCKGKSQPYTGSLVSSNPSDGVAGHTGFQFTYGYVEWHVYLPPDSTGQIANWPATWSTGQCWPTDGENDILEGLGGSACYHFHSPSGVPGGCASGHYSGWHTFASDWEPGVVTYYYDGVQVGQISNGITAAPHYLIMANTQGTYGGQTLVPSDMLIDYVRVWQKCTSNYTPTATPTPPTATSTPTPTLGTTLGPNLIVNPGCENGVTNWAGWQANVTQTTAVAHSGSASCNVAQTTGSVYSINASPDPVTNPQQGIWYTATAWVRSDASVGKPAYLAIRFNGGVNPSKTIYGPGVTLSTTWQQLTNTQSVDYPDRTSITYYVVQENASGTDSFQADDMTFQQVIPVTPTNTPTPTFTPTPTPVPVNLIQNGSFENTGTNWLLPWTFGVKSGANATIAQVSGTKVEGNYSARGNVKQANTTDWYVQLMQNSIPITAGRTYTISFWAKASVNRPISAVIQQAYSPWAEYFHQSLNLTTGWKQYTYTFIPTQSDTNTMLVFNLAQHTGYVWIDAVSMKGL